MAFVKADLSHFDVGLSSDTTANDSDKTITVTTGQVWHVHAIRVTLAATGTAGTRTLSIVLKDDSSNTVYTYSIDNPNVTAGQTMTWNFYPEAISVAPVDGSTEGSQAFHDLRLPEGYGLNILDSAGIDAAADDLSIWVFRTAYKV